jgi:hypothetical protein
MTEQQIKHLEWAAEYAAPLTATLAQEMEVRASGGTIREEADAIAANLASLDSLKPGDTLHLTGGFIVGFLDLDSPGDDPLVCLGTSVIRLSKARPLLEDAIRGGAIVKRGGG